MALTTQEQTALRAILTREGGIDALHDEMRQLVISDRKAAAQTALGPVVSVSVSDWTALGTFLAAQNTNAAFIALVGDIGTSLAAHDATKLGPLFVQLYANAKAHLGL